MQNESKTEIWIEKDVLKLELGSGLDWKIVETF